MTGLSNHALQKEIYSALTGNAPLMAQVTGVWDEPEEKAALPIVVIGDGTTNDFSTKTEKGQNQTITVHVWSDAKGRMEVKNIMGLVYDALHEASLALSGHDLVLLRFESATDFREREDGRTLYHGAMIFRALTQNV